jgi:hypothetical protein
MVWPPQKYLLLRDHPELGEEVVPSNRSSLGARCIDRFGVKGLRTTRTQFYLNFGPSPGGEEKKTLGGKGIAIKMNAAIAVV